MAYTGTYTKPLGTAQDIGILDDNGWEISFAPKGQDVNDTDQFGMTLIEGIYRGQDWRNRFRTKEWGMQGLLDILHTFGEIGAGAGAAPAVALGIIARRYTDMAGTLILTSTAGTPAESSPASLTASLALLSPNNNIGFMLTSKVREVPVEMLMLPYEVTVSGTTYVVPFITV